MAVTVWQREYDCSLPLNTLSTRHKGTEVKLSDSAYLYFIGCFILIHWVDTYPYHYNLGFRLPYPR